VNDLTERGQLVLKAIVERHIQDGVPVGSKALTNASGFNYSPATIRSVMADLEARGLICSPHTSAGRVPTVGGYRLFVDSLVTMRPIDSETINSLRSGFSSDLTTNKLVTSASRMLSEVSHQAGLVMLPRRDVESLRHVEFLPLSNNRVLAILVGNQQEVQNRVMHVGRQFSEDELQRAANYINQNYVGKPLTIIHAGLIAAMQSDQELITNQMQAAIDMASQVFTATEDADYVVAGESHLLAENVDSTDMGRIKSLLHAFEQKKDILDLMSSCVDAPGTQIFIGNESGFDVLDDYSVVTTPYQMAGNAVGVLGVIGPTRMAYEKVVPLVDITAKLLSAALDKN
jgi:heat-inducible transcriptional repressor